jgi:hypothetical protein
MYTISCDEILFVFLLTYTHLCDIIHPQKTNICSYFYRKEATVTEEKIGGSCAECGDLLPEGAMAYFLGERLYCPACVRSSRTAVGIYPVIPPGGSRKSEKIYAETAEKRLYFKERRRT